MRRALSTLLILAALAAWAAPGAGADDRCRAMKAQLARGGGSASGLMVMDADTGAVLCRRAASRRLPIASNMKLFTTGTAIARLGPRARIATRIVATGSLAPGGVLRGSLYLVGGGDPALGSPAFQRRFFGGFGTNLFALRRQVRTAGIRAVTGRLYADDSIFDRRRGVADSGYATSPYIGPLSGLAFNSGYGSSRGRGFASDPARLAGRKLARSLRRAGVRLRGGVALGRAPAAAWRVGAVHSPPIAALAEATNEPSNNFYAEMLIKLLGARFGGAGTTAAGAAVVERFARSLGSSLRAVDGSGLTRTNRASPAAIARFLRGMRRHRAGEEFIESLATAAREGTVADRMGGTAAAGRCHLKTGTLTGVSALSGYCLNRSGRAIVFSILMAGAYDLSGARRAQDRIAAAAATY